MSGPIFRSVSSDEWIARLHSDRDGSVHTEWLLLESTLHRDDEQLDSEYCTCDDSRLKVWAAFDVTRTPVDVAQFCRWNRGLLWLTRLSDPSSTSQVTEQETAHAIAHRDLPAVLDIFSDEDFKATSEYIPTWQIYAAVKLILENPTKADTRPVAVSNLLSIIYERFRESEPSAEDGPADRQAKLLESMIANEESLNILIEYTMQDGQEGVGILESHLPLSEILPRSIFHLVLNEYSDLVDMADLRGHWPPEAKQSYALLEDMGSPPKEAACMAWEQYHSKKLNIAAALPNLETGQLTVAAKETPCQ
jgi:hypothetical protein